MNFQTPVKGKFSDTRLVPGCWIESKWFGLAVLVNIEDSWVHFRYEAIHLQSQKTIWVMNGDSEVAFVRPADDLSREVLTLEGPYGLGEDRP